MREALLLRSVAAALLLALPGCGSETAPDPILALSAEPAAIALDGVSTLTAVLTTASGTPIAGISLEWSSGEAESLLRVGGATDANGRSSATLEGLGVAGVAAISVRVPGTSIQGRTTVRIGS
jgi:hypothetical protein